MNAHDLPSAAELVEAVREFLEGDVMGATEGRVRYHTRVAVNVLRMVERELSEQPPADRDEQWDLVRAIRDGTDDAATRARTRETVEAKLRVANPSYLAPS